MSDNGSVAGSDAGMEYDYDEPLEEEVPETDANGDVRMEILPTAGGNQDVRKDSLS